jgi:hypothetical protein
MSTWQVSVVWIEQSTTREQLKREQSATREMLAISELSAMREW